MTSVSDLFVAAVNHHQSGQLDQAQLGYEQVLAIQPDHADALHLLGISFYQRGRYPEAIERIRQAVASAPDNASYQSNLGAAYQAAGDLNSAVPHLRQAAALNPDSVAAQFNLGLALAKQGQHKQAKVHYQKTLQLEPGNAEAHLNLSLSLAELGELAEAQQALEQAIALQPSYFEAHYQLGTLHQKAQRWPAAIASLRAALQLKPEHAASHLQLGIAYSQSGDAKQANAHFKKAIKLDPNSAADAYLNLGVVAGEQGNRQEERNYYRKAIDIRPEYPRAYNNWGAAIVQQLAAEKEMLSLEDLQKRDALTDPRFQEASDNFQLALAFQPRYPEAYYNLGLLHRQYYRIHESQIYFQKAIDLREDYVEARYSLGCYFLDAGNVGNAIAEFEKVIDLQPDYSEAYNNLGRAYQFSGKDDDALLQYRRAISINPDFAEANSNIGVILFNQGKLEEALAYFDESIRQKPSNSDAYFYRGVILGKQSRTQEAIDSYKKAIEYKPNNAIAYMNMGGAYLEQCRHEEAIKYYRKSREVSPEIVGPASNILMGMHYAPDFNPEEAFIEHQRWGHAYQSAIYQYWKPHLNDPNPDRPLRIGYISGDFRMHSVNYFMEHILENHNQIQFPLYCYSNVDHPDAVTKKVESLATVFRSIAKLTDYQAAERIRQDRVDILIDLGGHTGGSRMPVLGFRPAPVQATYVGYADTTGMSVVDYRITDNVADPEDVTDHWHTEKLVRLPDCFLCYRPSAEAPAVIAPPVTERGYITYGCCNNPSKITPVVLELWAEILKAVPGSKLQLKNQRYRDPSTCDLLWERIGSHGIEKERVLLVHDRQGFAEHFAAYGEVDIGLDPFPYNGTTTTCETLWMGVPVVALEGQAHVSRVGVSILSTLGLSDLIAKTPEEYVQIATQLAQNSVDLSELRFSMRDRMLGSPLLNPKRFTKYLEIAYRQMWRQWCTNSKGRIRFRKAK